MRQFFLAVICVLACATAQSAWTAPLVVQPIDAIASTTIDPPFHDRSADKAIDGSGLSNSSIVETGNPVPVAWPTHTNNAGIDSTASMWQSGIDHDDPDFIQAQWIMFDLGDVYPLQAARVWNYNEFSGVEPFNQNGINDVLISFAIELDSFGDPDDAGWSSPTAFEFSLASGLNSYTGETYPLSELTQARYVLFDIQTNHGFVRAGLSEVRFIAIPEPGSLALLSIGNVLMLQCWARRRRDRFAGFPILRP